MGWAPLPADVQLDNTAQEPATAAPTTDQVQSEPAEPQTVPAAPSAAPVGFAPLPADAKLDGSSDHTGPAKVQPQGYTLHGDFADTMERHASELPADVQQKVVSILANDPLDKAADNARAYLRPLGIYPNAATDPKFRDSFDEEIAYRKSHGTVSDSVINTLMSPKEAAKEEGATLDAGGAAIRGVADAPTAGLVTHIDSALHAAKDVLTGDAKGGVVNDFNHWEDVNQSILHSDEANHPYARLTGQIIGGMVLPTGTEGVALEAGKSVLVAGGTMREARAAAAAAARNRIAVEAAGYGAVHGAATADPGHRAEGLLEGAAEGGAGGYALAAAGQVAPKVIDAVSDLVPAATEKAAPDYVQLAQDLNIRRTPATNSKSGVSTVVQAGLGALPGGTPVGQAAEREVGDLANAARGVAEGVGQVSDRQGAGEAVAQGALSYKGLSKAQATELYRQRDAAMGGSSAPVSLDNFTKSATELAHQFPNSPALTQLREHPVIRRVTDALGQAAEDGQVTLGKATEALSHVRGVIRNLEAKNDASPVVISRVRQLEQSLENDVMNGAKAADQATGRVPGSPGSAVKAQKDADAFYADRASALNGSLKKPLASAKDDTRVSGEAVYNQVAGDMDAKSGNLSRLRDTWFRLPQQAKSTFAATRIDDLGRATPGQQNDAGDAWSFQTFLTNLNKLSPQARNIVFGSNADGQLQKIATYANRLRQLDRARNFSNTAQKYFAGAFMATVGHAVVSGDIGGAVEAAMALPATWGGAKLLLSSPAMRDWTASAMKAATSGNETAAKVLTKKLGAIASTEPAFQSEILGLQQAIQHAANDNLRSLAASGSHQNPDGEGKKAQGPR